MNIRFEFRRKGSFVESFVEDRLLFIACSTLPRPPSIWPLKKSIQDSETITTTPRQMVEAFGTVVHAIEGNGVYG